MCSLINLPDEILCKIFKYCDPHDVFRLRGVCHRFHDLVGTSLDYLITQDALVTNQRDDMMKERSQKTLSTEDKWILSNNWRTSGWHTSVFLKETISYFNVERDFIHCTVGNCVMKFKRCGGDFASDGVPVMSTKNKINSTKISNRYIAASERRQLLVHSRSTSKTYSEVLPKTARMIDLKDNVMATVDSCGITLWNNIEEKKTLNKTMNKNSECMLACVAFNPVDTSLAIHCCEDALQLLDYSTGVCKQVTRKQRRVHTARDDIKWMDANNLLILRDRVVRLCDTRVGAYVIKWNSPNEWNMTSIDTDRVCTLLAGTNTFGSVHLFDTRRRGCVRTYNFHDKHISRVSMVSFDVENLMISVYNQLHVMNFSR